jgi:hypothetical protein
MVAGTRQWCLGLGKGLFEYKAKRCYSIAVEAIGHEQATPKQEWSAKQKWRDVFGTAFPN